MVDLFGFTVAMVNGQKEENEDAVEYENDLLTIQHWKIPNVCIISIRRDIFLVYKTEDELSEEIDRTKRAPASVYKIKDGINGSQRRMAEILLESTMHILPIYFGTIKNETFFEILLASICTDVDKIMQCGS